TPQYPVPFATRQMVEEEVAEMLKLEVKEKLASPYRSPLVLVKKPEGSYRVCIDFRRLNDILVPDAEPIPRIEDVFAEVGNKVYFSKLDLSKGYWEIPLANDLKKKTAFSPESVLYQFKYMPFGIKTESAVFTRLMRRVLAGIQGVQHYINH
ncbi:polyprotein of retroviral origin, putative, partial [Ixodes scapularis]